ncbi:MAG: hypothetical protein SWK90_01300 [Chloroflexota bacterium]|nr:hypothetical protein [Chloroflexota bacterium]
MLQNYSVTQAEHKSVENWPRVFDELGVQFLVLDRHSDNDLLDLFRSQPGWALDFEDEETVIFARSPSRRF